MGTSSGAVCTVRPASRWSGMLNTPGPRRRPAQLPMGGFTLGKRLGPLSRARMPVMVQVVIAVVYRKDPL